MDTSTTTSWVTGATGSGHDLDHLPYGVFSTEDEPPRVGVRIGDRVLDAAPLAASQMLDTHHLFDTGSLDELLAAGPTVWAAVREWLTTLLADPSAAAEVEPFLVDLAAVTLHQPFTVGDYVDFYASEVHATNVGRIFRPDQAPLLPNWKHLPVGYHGRGGTVVVSGTDVVRPGGQRLATPGNPDDGVVFGPSTRLDLEAEVGFVIGAGHPRGTRIDVAEMDRHVFGVVGLNDWSARDIQAWEYVPLGPFLGKSFATSISAWVTPLAALDAAWTPLPGQDPRPLDYLGPDVARGLDLQLEVEINGHVVSRPRYDSMYWSPAQMLAHLSVNGASTRPGDLFASGTVSDAEQFGSLLELTWGWREPVRVGDDTRTALEDGDEVVLRVSAPGTGGGRITFGEVAGRVLPAPA